MNDVLVTFLFTMFVLIRAAWLRNGNGKCLFVLVKGLTGVFAGIASVLLILMWAGVFSSTWIIGLISIYGSFIVIGEMLEWCRFRKGVLCKIAYHLVIAIGLGVGFCTNGVKAFVADVYANAVRVDDIAAADGLARYCYENRFGTGTFRGKPFVRKISRNEYRYEFGAMTQNGHFVSSTGDVVIVVDRRTGEAYFPKTAK